MNRTALASHLAPVADAARPCGGFALGFQWRNTAMYVAMSTNDIATKRTARRLGMATT